MLLVAGFLVFWVLLLSGNILWTSNTPPLQVIDDMDNQQKAKPQVASHFFADGAATRPPIEGTIPRNGSMYTVESPDDAESANVNTVPRTPFVLARGKNRYDVYCAPCHAQDAKGNGMVVQKGFTPPPDLLRDATKELSDARLFHVLSAGQNIMPSYADKLSVVDRWAVIHYLRELQGVPAHAAAQTSEQSTDTQQQ